MIKKIIHTLRHLSQTVHSDYGRGPRSYVSFFYYSLFRLNSFYVYAIDLTTIVEGKQQNDGYDFAQPSMTELEMLRSGRKLPREFYFDQIGGLEQCFVAWKDTDLAYIHWIYHPHFKSRFFRLSDNVVEINNCITLPHHRGKRIMTSMLKYTNFELKKAGHKYAVAAVHSENIASIKSFEKAGFIRRYQIKTLGPINRKVTI